MSLELRSCLTFQEGQVFDTSKVLSDTNITTITKITATPTVKTITPTQLSAADTNLNMWTCQFNMGTDQKWEVQWSTFDSCAFRLKNKDTHMCIDAPGKTSDGKAF